MNTTKTKTMKVNGKAYTVTSASDKIVQLTGPRGGEAMLVKNVHSGRWILIEGNGLHPRVSEIKSIETDFAL